MPNNIYVNINGKLLLGHDALIPTDNGAFRYGIGLFETMLVQDGAIKLASYHWARLFAGMQVLPFDVPPLMTPGFLESEVLRTVSKNKLGHLCRVRLQVYAGSGGIFEAGNKHPLFVIECYPLGPETQLLNENGLVVGIAEGVRKSTDSLCNLKTSNALVYAIAAAQAKQNKWNDALVRNTAGNIIESAIANVFWIKGDKLYTPPLTEGCVAGVMRRDIIDKLGIVTEAALTTEILYDADEVFLTNAIKPLRWVSRIGDKLYGNTHTRNIFARLFP
jgi:branched-chain amino acid aminotransferase